MPHHFGAQVPCGVMSTGGVEKGALQLQASRIVGQHGGSWTAATTHTLFVLLITAPRSMTKSKEWSGRWTLLSGDLEWRALGAI